MQHVYFYAIMFYFIKIKTTGLYRVILLRYDQIIDRGNSSNNRRVQLINPRLMCLTVCDKYLNDTDVLRC